MLLTKLWCQARLFDWNFWQVCMPLIANIMFILVRDCFTLLRERYMGKERKGERLKKKKAKAYIYVMDWSSDVGLSTWSYIDMIFFSRQAQFYLMWALLQSTNFKEQKAKITQPLSFRTCVIASKKTLHCRYAIKCSDIWNTMLSPKNSTLKICNQVLRYLKQKAVEEIKTNKL